MFGFFAALSIDALPLLSQFLMLALTIVTFVLVYYLIQPWWKQRQSSQRSLENTLPDSVVVTSQPLIPAAEVPLFNLLHFVSRDMFLVFAKIPMRMLVQVNADETNVRRDMAKAMRSLIADYVLIHPGTMVPRKIILVESPHGEDKQSLASFALMTVLCRDAEIDMIRLEADKNYSAAELTHILGLNEDE